MEQIVAQWTQNEAIDFECAREVITELMAYYSSQIAEESERSQPDVAHIEQLRDERSRLAGERANLHVLDHDNVSRVLLEYGARVRALREEPEVLTM
jgi:hypothetical protein